MRVRRMGSKHGVYLEVRLDPDSDISVSVGEIGGEEKTVDFPCQVAGGGNSPRTYTALDNLLRAMEEDNEDPALPETLKGRYGHG